MALKQTVKKFKSMSLLEKIENDRNNIANSVMEFKFNKKRIKNLTSLNNVNSECSGILYWMNRDVRVQDNWAVLFAQKTAMKNKVPLHICYCIPPTFLRASMRHYKFLLKGLKEVEEECRTLNVNFHLLKGEPHETISKFIEKKDFGAIITDFFPLREPTYWLEELQKNISKDLPICQVDAHNIVPCWIASDKLEYAARTIRNKINSKLDEYLTEFPPVIKHPYSSKKFPNNDWECALDHVEADKSVPEIEWAKPGYTNGIIQLEEFIQNRLKVYNTKRNDPNADAVSDLSPWLHFGFISPQRCILEVKPYVKTYPESVKSFLEETIVRRELSDNFCFYNELYDSIKGTNSWAMETLEKHSLKELENCKTHDDLWNAAQNQLLVQGKIHGFLRMYWAKKILEWTSSPEDALKYAIYLNDKFSIDGNDPNGFVGCMWSICGIHDQGWREREIFGKIRYMNYQGCERKFDVKSFVLKHGKNDQKKMKTVKK